MRTRRVLCSAAVVLLTGMGLSVGATPVEAATGGVTVAGGNGTGPAANQFDTPISVAVDSSNDVYVADYQNGRVQRWAPGAASGVTVVGSGLIRFPLGVALDGQRNVYVGQDSAVWMFPANGTAPVEVAGGHGPGIDANQLNGACRLAVRFGTVFVADTYNNRVQMWTPGATTGITVAGGHGPGSAANQLDHPTGVALDPSGNVYVADTNNNRVQRWTPGATTGITVAGGQGAGSAANQLDYPSDVVLDGFSNLYVADVYNSRVQMWAPGASSGVTVAGGNGQGAGADQFDFPADVALDRDRNIYVADMYNERVQRWPAAIPTAVPGVGSGLEGNASTANLRVPVTLSNPASQTITVPWRTLFAAGAPGNQADPATDYTPTSGTVTFAPGQTTGTVNIPVNGDSFVEPDEYIVVSFHDPTNAAMGGFWGLGFGVITNDD